ncbi:MAG: sulfatase-like hydrolase/transferase [Pirellulaceae bacterium]|nr:sulfatase-like hydrolase/transferase [Pirellulaceae bacterium]
MAVPSRSAESAAPPVTKPNIVFILADDLGYGDLACYGGTHIKTPRLSQLAREGVRFAAFYASGPECTPTRTALLTGRYQQRVGGLECAIGTGNVGRYDDAIRLREQNELGLPTSEPTIARMLNEAGYATAITGKWHLGYEPKFAPHLHGFERTFYCIGGGMDYFHYLDNVAGYNLFVDGNPVRREGYFTDLATDEAIRFVREQRECSFFLYLPYTVPHSPYQGPADEQLDPLPLDSPLWNQSAAPPGVYAAMIEYMDLCIGRILDTLDELGLRDNTVVVFTSDNGASRAGSNAPFSGHKGSTNEGGIRVPAIVRWPGVLPAGSVSHQVGITFDLTASMARIAGVQPAEGKPFEGIDLLGHVADGKPDIDRTLFWRKPRGKSLWSGVREGSLKNIGKRDGDRFDEFFFDLASDPAEQENLRDARPADFARLKQRYDDWEREVRADRRGQPED